MYHINLKVIIIIGFVVLLLKPRFQTEAIVIILQTISQSILNRTLEFDKLVR